MRRGKRECEVTLRGWGEHGIGEKREDGERRERKAEERWNRGGEKNELGMGMRKERGRWKREI